MSCKQPLANLDGIYIYGPNHFRQSWRQGRKFLKAIALTKLVQSQKLLNSSLLIGQKIFSGNQKGALPSLVVQASSEVILPPENIQNPLLPLELRWCNNYHFIFCQGPCLIRQQVSYSPQFFGNRTATDHCAGNVFIVYNKPRVHYFSHIQAYSETVKNTTKLTS